MTTTVTLQLDEKLSDSAQHYALQHGKSISLLIEDYLKNLASQSNKTEIKKPFPITTVEDGFGCVNYQGRVLSLEEMEIGVAEELREIL